MIRTGYGLDCDNNLLEFSAMIRSLVGACSRRTSKRSFGDKACGDGEPVAKITAGDSFGKKVIC